MLLNHNYNIYNDQNSTLTTITALKNPINAINAKTQSRLNLVSTFKCLASDSFGKIVSRASKVYRLIVDNDILDQQQKSNLENCKFFFRFFNNLAN